MIRRSFHEVDIEILYYVCAPNYRAANDMKQKLVEMKGEIGKSSWSRRLKHPSPHN